MDKKFDLEKAKSGEKINFNGKLFDGADFTNATVHLSGIGQEIVCFKLHEKNFDCPSSLLTMA